MHPEGLADHPLDPVAAHCSTNQPVHADTEAAHVPAVGDKDHGKSLSLKPFPLPVYLHKLPRFPQKALLGESELFHRLRLTDVFYPWPVDS